jgi:hypothetical protein
MKQEDQPSTDTQAEDSILRGREKDGLGASVPARLGSIRTCCVAVKTFLLRSFASKG